MKSVPARSTVRRVLVALLLLIAIASPKAQSVRDRLIGTWYLVKYDVIAADGTTRPGTYDTGSVTYDAAGHMTAHLIRAANRPTAAPGSAAERSAAYQSYLGYYGPFTLDESRGIVVHHVKGSSFPHWLGTDQVRYYALSSDGRTLTLSVKDGDRVTQSLIWAKQAGR